MKYEKLTESILAAAFEVSNELGNGFLETVYEKALLLTLKEKGIHVEAQKPLNVLFRNQVVGKFVADIIVESKVILELKAVKAIAPEHIAQVLNYIKATDLDVGFLLNFGKSRLEYRRFNNHFD
ncbi:MAG: GxxExxY protein [Pseudomonadota bacterium]|nr:GxxExxY protein [Pseudomonadota bacterium]